MNRLFIAVATTGLLAISPLPASATSIATAYSSFWVLGDSLSDFGNLASEGAVISPNPNVYTSGRFSNGPVWNEDLIADFAAKGKSADNFADGGATISLNRTGPGIPTDLQGQLGELASVAPTDFGTSPLVSLWFGANDLLGSLLPPTGNPTPPPEVVATLTASALVGAVGNLMTQGFNDFLLFEIPDLGKTPLFNLGNPALVADATAAAMKFNETLQAGLTGLTFLGADITVIETFALSQDLFDNPLKYGVFNSTLPCVQDPSDPVGAVCSPAQAAALAYYDPVHPTTQIHSEIALRVEDQLSVVPLPAPALMLLTCLGGLAVAGRRKAPRGTSNPCQHHAGDD